jgi:predicted alpha/beta-hydrolase family hydrolase
MASDEGFAVEPPTSRSGCVFVLAHGAGGSMKDPLIVGVAKGLRARGHGVVRFDFEYRRAGKKLPSPAAVLEEEYVAAIRRAREALGLGPRSKRRVVIGGKSMGGRMASHLAADGEPISGLVLLSYPLHPANRTDKLRVDHLPRIRVPTLFLQGTRDPLCDLELMKHHVDAMGEVPELSIVEGGDHSLEVRGPGKRIPREVHEDVAARIDEWTQRAVPKR